MFDKARIDRDAEHLLDTLKAWEKHGYSALLRQVSQFLYNFSVDLIAEREKNERREVRSSVVAGLAANPAIRSFDDIDLNFVDQLVGIVYSGDAAKAADETKAKADALAIKHAVEIIDQYGGTDGAHHKHWVLDQVLRTLLRTDEEYAKWVQQRRAEGYGWDKGIAP